MRTSCRFSSELAESFAHKRVLFSEFGNPTCPPGIAEMSGFACLSEQGDGGLRPRRSRSLATAWRARRFFWCWADYAAELAATPPFDGAPHELTFGIVRDDGSEKPVARVLEAFARERRKLAPPPRPIANESAYYAGLPGSLEIAYEAYCAAHVEGIDGSQRPNLPA